MIQKIFVILILFLSSFVFATDETGKATSDNQKKSGESQKSEKSEKADSSFDNRDTDIRALMMASPKDVMRLRSATEDRDVAMFKELHEHTVISDETEINFSNNEQPPLLNILDGEPSTVSFVDATGEPWPIARIHGEKGQYISAEIVENEFNNSVSIAGVKAAGEGFLNVFLQGLPSTPITIKCHISTGTYNNFKSVKINQIGPNTKINEINNVIAQDLGLEADVDLQAALYDVMPTEARIVETHNPNVKAWEKGDFLFVRTSLVIFLPQPLRVEGGKTGTGIRAYKLPKTTRLSATNSAGKTISITLGEGA
jgi:intracellular multiplication protein IcmK